MRRLRTAALSLAVMMGLIGTALAADKTWKDEKSGLTWQMTPTGGKMNWGKAKAHCAGLALAGHTDWRLPTLAELKSQVREENDEQGCRRPHEMQGVCYWWYWSSSPVSDRADSAPTVLFNNTEALKFDGNDTVGFEEVNSTGAVRCVR